jgi:PAS domain S-box-containing protein
MKDGQSGEALLDRIQQLSQSLDSLDPVQDAEAQALQRLRSQIDQILRKHCPPIDGLPENQADLSDILASGHSSRFIELAESVQDGFFELSRDWHFIYLNQRAARNLHCRPGDLLGKNIWDTFPGVLGTSYERYYHQVMEQRQPASFEIEGILDDKSYEIRVNPCSVGISVFWIDITQRKLAEEVLARSNRKISEILSSITDDFYVLDRDWKFVYANQQFTGKIGKKPEDFIGNCIWEMFPKHVGSILYENFQASMEKGEKRRFEIGGQYTDAWYSMTSFPSAEGITVLGTEITERKEAEEEIRRSHQALATAGNRLLAVMEALPVGVAILDEAGGIVMQNPAFTEIWGNPHPQVRSMEDYDLYLAWWAETDQRVAPEEWASAQAVLKGETVTGQFIRIQKFTGEESYILNSGAPIRDGEGKIVGAVVALLEISERIRAEQALKASEERFRKVWEVSTDALALSGPDGTVWMANPAYYKLYAYSEDEVVGKNFSVIFPEEAREWANEEYQKVFLSSEPPPAFEAHVQRADGTRRIVESRAVFIQKEGKRQAMLSIIRDITENAQAEQALKASEERFRALADSNPSLIWMSDPQAKNLFVNCTYQDYFGIPLDRTMGDQWQEYLHPEDAPSYLEAFEEAFRTRSTFRREFRARRKDGVFRIMEVHAVPRFSPEGEFLGYIGNNSDITERVEAEVQRQSHLVQIELQRRLLEEREQERIQIARDLHDGPMQALRAAVLGLDTILMDNLCPSAVDPLMEIKSNIKDQVTELREYAFQLRPPTLFHFGLGITIRSQMESMQESHPELQLVYTEQQDGTLIPEEKRLGLFRIFQACMANIFKHAQASAVQVFLST